MKEKEALEASLRALSATPSRDTSHDLSSTDGNSTLSEGEGEASESELNRTAEDRQRQGWRTSDLL